MGMGGGGKSGLKDDINVTPLVDVVLVLLIIFMVTMPILMRQITIEVPRKLADDEEPAVAARQITVLVRADGTVKISDGFSDKEVQRVELASTLLPLVEKKKTEKVVFVDFEDEVVYGDAVSVMDTVKGVGAEKVALKVREEAGQPGAP